MSLADSSYPLLSVSGLWAPTAISADWRVACARATSVWPLIRATAMTVTS
jgi:hypothetical protein